MVLNVPKRQMLKFFPDSWLKKGRLNCASKQAITAAINVISKASEINKPTRLFLDEPITFLIPISFTRMADRAVDKFM